MNLIQADVSSWHPMKQIDLIISENIYTGMFYEMQIPILNHLLPFISSSCQVIPGGMSSYVILAQTEKPLHKGLGELFSPSQAEGRRQIIESFPNHFYMIVLTSIRKTVSIAGLI